MLPLIGLPDKQLIIWIHNVIMEDFLDTNTWHRDHVYRILAFGYVIVEAFDAPRHCLFFVNIVHPCLLIQYYSSMEDF